MNTKAKQMTDWHSKLTFPPCNFLSQEGFLFTPSFNWSHQEADNFKKWFFLIIEICFLFTWLPVSLIFQMLSIIFEKIYFIDKKCIFYSPILYINTFLLGLDLMIYSSSQSFMGLTGTYIFAMHLCGTEGPCPVWIFF